MDEVPVCAIFLAFRKQFYDGNSYPEKNEDPPQEKWHMNSFNSHSLTHETSETSEDSEEEDSDLQQNKQEYARNNKSRKKKIPQIKTPKNEHMSDYEKRILQNQKERLALLKTLEIDKVKEDLVNALKSLPNSKSKMLKNMSQDVKKPNIATRTSRRKNLRK